MNERDWVMKAAADLVSAFARNDLKAYFGRFSTDANFVDVTTELRMHPTMASLSKTDVTFVSMSSSQRQV